MEKMIETRLQIPLSLIAQAVASQAPVDRHRVMVDRLGEACTKTTAAREIETSVRTINNMIEDGRILAACEGTRVDVRSLADYIEHRSDADHQARMQRKRWRK